MVGETEGELISLGKDEFERFPPCRDDVVSMILHGSFLLRIPLFSRLPSRVLSEYASQLATRTYPKGFTLLPSGEQLTFLILVKEGSLVTGTESAGPGVVMGLTSLVAPPVYTEPVTTPDGATALVIPIQAVVESIRSWLNGFDGLEDLAGRQSTAGW